MKKIKYLGLHHRRSGGSVVLYSVSFSGYIRADGSCSQDQMRSYGGFPRKFNMSRYDVNHDPMSYR